LVFCFQLFSDFSIQFFKKIGDLLKTGTAYFLSKSVKPFKKIRKKSIVEL